MNLPASDRHVLDDLLDFLEGQLEPAEADQVSAHLTRCERCAAVYRWAEDQRREVIDAGLRHLSPDRMIAIADSGGTVTPAEAKHLSWCGACRRDLGWSRDTAAADPTSVVIQQNNVFLNWDTGARRSPAGRWSTAGWVIAVVAVLALGVVGLLRVRSAWLQPEVAGNTVSATAGVFGEVWREEHQSEIGPWFVVPWADGRTIVYGLEGGATDGGRVIAHPLRERSAAWSTEPDLAEVGAVFGREYADQGAFRVSAMELGDFDGDGSDELIVLWGHTRWYPTIIARVGADGQPLGSYYHFGGVYDLHVEDLDGDGRDELLFAATNNGKAYQGATLGILEEEHWQGASVDSLVGAGSPLREGAAYRVVLPQYPPPYMQLLRADRLRAEGVSTSRRDGPLRIEASVGTEDGLGSVVTFDETLRPIRTQIGDTLFRATRGWPADARERFVDPSFQAEWLEGARLFGRRREGGAAP